MIASLIPTLLPVIGDVIGRFLPEDKEAAAKAKREIEAELTKNLAQIDLAQLDINKAEGQHRSMFVAGWRPFIGWTCGVALAYTYVMQPILVFILAQSGYLVQLPIMDLTVMMPVLLGMLGLGGLRSFEKFKGVSK
jgi:hypothetical protein|tara:strand:+ start:2111 stop:2518 length:408 start_codon:yes stop_codon:yes gene_type:complete